ALHPPRWDGRRRRRVSGGDEGLARPGAVPAAACADGELVRRRPPAHRRADADRPLHERQVQAEGDDLAHGAADRPQPRLRRDAEGRGQAQRGGVLAASVARPCPADHGVYTLLAERITREEGRVYLSLINLCEALDITERERGLVTSRRTP